MCSAVTDGQKKHIKAGYFCKYLESVYQSDEEREGHGL